MEEAQEFLLNNGFVQDEFERSIWRGKRCNVRIFHDHYAVISYDWTDVKELGFLYSKDLNIYWLEYICYFLIEFV